MRRRAASHSRGEARPVAGALETQPTQRLSPEASNRTAVEAAAKTSVGLWLLVAAVSLGGLALVAYGGWNSAHMDWQALIVLAAMAAVAERFDFGLYGDSRVSLAFVPIFAAIIISGVSGLALVVPSAMVASAVGTQRPLYKTAFNIGALMLAGAASVLVLQAFGSASNPESWPIVLGPALLAAGANFAANSGLVAAVIAVSTRANPRSVWAEHFGWLWPHYLVLGVLGLAMASGYAAMGLWGIAVFVAPPFMMRLSMKQYLDRTTKGVLELRQAHEELQAAHSQITEAMTSLGRAYDGTLRSLVAALDARDRETCGHSERVADLALAIGEEMGIARDSQQWRDLQWGALLHDVGKIAIPDEVLRRPDGLSDDDWAIMRGHPAAGYEILQTVEFLAAAAEIVRAHHEQYDGSGYPRGLAGEEIPLGARIFAAADAFDAMTSHRHYRGARPPEEALAEILRHTGTQFDPTVVRAFLSVYQARFLNSGRGRPPQHQLSEALKKAILDAAGLESSS
jgi:putative nucleotidyltransferase with HDIG domain